MSFYRDVLGLAVYREFGDRGAPGHEPLGTVFFLGGGFLEVSGSAPDPPGPNVELWLQVRDVDEVCARLKDAGVEVLRPPVTEPWGLRECWIADPDGVRIALIQVPDDHPLRRRP